MWLLAQQAPALLGFILFRLTLDGEDDTETLYVYELQVVEKARRLELGKHLMQVGCEWVARVVPAVGDMFFLRTWLR